MASFQDIADGIAAQFEPLGLRTYGYAPDNADPPLLIVSLDEAKPTTMNRGWFEAKFNVWILTGSVTDRVGQKELAELVSPLTADSVWTAFGLNNDLDLTDGTAATAVVFKNQQTVELAGIRYYGGVLEVSVTTPGA